MAGLHTVLMQATEAATKGQPNRRISVVGAPGGRWRWNVGGIVLRGISRRRTPRMTSDMLATVNGSHDFLSRRVVNMFYERRSTRA